VHDVGSWILVLSITHELTQVLDINLTKDSTPSSMCDHAGQFPHPFTPTKPTYFCHSLRIGQRHRNLDRDGNLVDFEIWIGANDCARREVDTLATQMLTEASFFTFEALAQA